MKTIRRIMIVAGIVFTAVFLTAACDDDDKNDQTTVIGTWNLVESKADVTPVATATQTEEQLESQIANYLLIAVNSRIVITNKSVTFPLSVNGGTTQSKTYQYVLNDGIMSIASPMAGVPDLLGRHRFNGQCTENNFCWRFLYETLTSSSSKGCNL